MPVLGTFHRAFLTLPDRDQAADTIVGLINAATDTLDIASYTFNFDEKKRYFAILESILCAARRGVKVRLLTDLNEVTKEVQSTPSGESALVGGSQALLNNEAQQNPNLTIARRLPFPSSFGKMHNKYMIIDGKAVWTGSFNFTDSSFTGQHNTGILLVGSQIADTFRADFNLMWENSKEQGVSTVDDRIVVAKRGGQDVVISMLFSPTDNVSGIIESYLNEAKEKIYVGMFTLTSGYLARVLKNRAEAGIDVKVIASANQIFNFNSGLGLVLNKSTGTTVQDMNVLSKVGVRVWPPPQIENGKWTNQWTLLHDKCFVVDDSIFGIGSYNWTATTDSYSDENLVILTDSELNAAYTAEFNSLWNESIILSKDLN